MKDIKSALANGEVVVGTFAVSGSPTVVEVIGSAGIFDFVIIDTEHSPTSPLGIELNQMIAAAYVSDITPVVRVTQNNEAMIKKALNFGAKGIVVPHVNTKAQALEVVDACRYWPQGHRSCAPVHRACDYNPDTWAEHWKKANKEVLVAPLIEEDVAVNNLAEILSVDGIDVVFYGPFDLSMTYGLDGKSDNPKMLESFDRVLKLCKQKRIPVWGDADDARGAKMWIEMGCQMVTIGADLIDLRNVYRDLGSRIKEIKIPR